MVSMAEREEALRELQEGVVADLKDVVVDSSIIRGELTVEILPTAVPKVLTYLRDDPSCHFKMLIDICGADYPARDKRFDVVYHLLSLKHNQRIRLRVQIEEEATIPTATDVYSNAGWLERETWDMYGIYFADNPDLRRILTDYGFDGHPMRKDFPLTGYVEVRYDDEEKRVVYEPVKLTQDFRTFDFLSPWEGQGGTLPGDEKAPADDA